MFRFNNWWSVITPQILGWIYFCELIADHSFLITDWHKVAFFFLGVISISAFGYVFNDYCDIDSDRISGKKNSLSKFSSQIRILIILLPLIAGITCWALVHAATITNTLYALQILALILYSAPPVRFKKRKILGVVADSFYGHINPAFFTVFTFLPINSKTSAIIITLLALILVCTTFKGIRNIWLHQLADRKKDRQANIQTFVVKHGALFTLTFINNLLPFEVFFTVVLSLILSFLFPPFFIGFLLFCILTYFKFSGWKLAYIPQRQLKFKFLYFINDYYEGWLPVFLLIILCSRNPVFLFLLLLHLILFPAFITKLWNDIKTIQQNFKTEDDY